MNCYPCIILLSLTIAYFHFLAAESMNDLKTRCRAIVDQGVLLIYDHIPRIQRAKNDLEASEKREETQKKLSNLVVCFCAIAMMH